MYFLKPWSHMGSQYGFYHFLSDHDAREKQPNMYLPCERATIPEYINKGNSNKAIYIQDKVWFLKNINTHTPNKDVNNGK